MKTKHISFTRNTALRPIATQIFASRAVNGAFRKAGHNQSGLSPLIVAGLTLALGVAPSWAGPPNNDVSDARGNTAGGTNALLNNTTGFANTGFGQNALNFNTTGINNTASGNSALLFNTTGNFNTASGVSALQFNSTGSSNTAIGDTALLNNLTGNGNTASGRNALGRNDTGNNNTASGFAALQLNTAGGNNTASGVSALLSNLTGNDNTANGSQALKSNTTGNRNTANGVNALLSNTTGNDNTATGVIALFNNTGSSNIALGAGAGFNLTTGSNNIHIGNLGSASQSRQIRIGTQGTQTSTFIAGIRGATVAGGVGVIVDASGHLGTVTSSARFKDQIKPMDKASEAILALKPVTFHYKHALDPKGIPQFGLVAEQVEKVNPDLVARDEQGKVYTVRYEAVNAMLLNEFLKEHRVVEEQEATITEIKSTVTRQEATIAQQQKELKALAASLEAQASQIKKVSRQLEVGKPAPQLLVNYQ
ncbi:MAG: tail fiber domain-containing protein [Methylococcales bacterium]|nr:tail fiber domain-containing protein [Methylococcales bacterium]MDD5632259.1 tail fiber domain-containing protein [Methylococcales bacterium]